MTGRAADPLADAAAAAPRSAQPPAPVAKPAAERTPAQSGQWLSFLGGHAAEQGTPLPAGLRGPFEQAFGQNLAKVRIHTSDAAMHSAKQLGARAYVSGTDVVFGDGQYQPDSPTGQRLLAHELAHVVQQDKGTDRDGKISAAGSRSEAEAEHASHALAWGGLHARYSQVGEQVVEPGAVPGQTAAIELSTADATIQRVQLTYDDGPDAAGNTRLVLDALNAAGAKATFYLVGKRVAQGDNWRVVFDIAAAGHFIGNHAYDWNDTKNEHIFLSGSAQDRAEKILQTEWAIRDALIRGRSDAVTAKTWTTIPQANRDHIDDIIAHGTGRFRTPGFKSKPWDPNGTVTLAALDSVNQVLAATGLRPLRATILSSVLPDYEGVSVDSKDWQAGKTKADVENTVKGGTASNDDSILMHSRLERSAKATPAIVADIQSKKFTFDPTVQGALGSVGPSAGFAKLATISNPPTSSEIASARAWFKANYLTFGPYLSGAIALRIFQMAQKAGQPEVTAFIAEVKATTVKTPPPSGEVPLAGWMSANPEWSLFLNFFENWTLNKPFPKIKGVTI